MVRTPLSLGNNPQSASAKFAGMTWLFGEGFAGDESRPLRERRFAVYAEARLIFP
jgi:hypothetical protein